MTLRICECCTTACAADLPCCPHCGGTDLHEEGDMPKITRLGGATNAGDTLDAGDIVEVVVGDTAERAPVEVVEDDQAAEVDENEEAEGTLSGNDAEPDAEPVAATPQRPATSATKAEWVAYVEALGEDPGDATKAELIEAYGG